MEGTTIEAGIPKHLYPSEYQEVFGKRVPKKHKCLYQIDMEESDGRNMDRDFQK